MKMKIFGLSNFIKRKFIIKKSIEIRNKIKIINKIRGTPGELIYFKIFNEMTTKKIDFPVNLNFFLGYLLDFDLNKFLKQFILFKLFINFKMVNKIAYAFASKKKITHPLPNNFFIFFKKEKIGINYFNCKLSFLCRSFLEATKAILLVINIFFESKNLRNKDHVQFCDIPKNYNFNFKIKSRKDLFQWYFDNMNNKNINHIYCNGKKKEIIEKNIRITLNEQIIGQLSFFKKFFFIFLSLIYLFYAFLRFVFGNQYYFFISNEVILLFKTVLTKKVANNYFFSNSEFVYKPLWTYHVELRGSEVFLFYYASSFFGFKINNKYLPNEVGTESMSWKNIICWTRPIIDFLKKNIVKKNITYYQTEPINLKDFDDKKIIAKFSKKKIISIFDIPPRRNCIRSLYFFGENYRTEEIGIRFLEDIYEVFKNKKDFILLLKSKRLMDQQYSKKFKNFYQNFTKQKNICLLHPDVSASRLINNSYLAISIPWSSTAFIGEYYKKKSIFYDPFQMLDLNDRGRQNCKLVQGKKSLEKFANAL
jgi:polysaccharide biosynthesis PFTS motif protein